MKATWWSGPLFCRLRLWCSWYSIEVDGYIHSFIIVLFFRKTDSRHVSATYFDLETLTVWKREWKKSCHCCKCGNPVGWEVRRAAPLKMCLLWQHPVFVFESSDGIIFFSPHSYIDSFLLFEGGTLFWIFTSLRQFLKWIPQFHSNKVSLMSNRFFKFVSKEPHLASNIINEMFKLFRSFGLNNCGLSVWSWTCCVQNSLLLF